jgi:hypothetical protein
MKREVSADGYADVTEVLRKRIEGVYGVIMGADSTGYWRER